MTDDIIVSVNSNRKPLDEVISELKKFNFKVKDVMVNIDCVFGSIDRRSISDIKKIKGVNYVEFDKAQGNISEE